MHMISMNQVVCSELGETAVFFGELSNDDMMFISTPSAFLSMIRSLLDRSRWPHSLFSGSQRQVTTQNKFAWGLT